MYCNDKKDLLKNVAMNIEPKFNKFITDLNKTNRRNLLNYAQTAYRLQIISWLIISKGDKYYSIKDIPRTLKEYQCAVPSCMDGYEPVYGQQKLSKWVSCKM